MTPSKSFPPSFQHRPPCVRQPGLVFRPKAAQSLLAVRSFKRRELGVASQVPSFLKKRLTEIYICPLPRSLKRSRLDWTISDPLQANNDFTATMPRARPARAPCSALAASGILIPGPRIKASTTLAANGKVDRDVQNVEPVPGASGPLAAAMLFAECSSIDWVIHRRHTN